MARRGDNVEGVFFEGFHLQPLAGGGEGDKADVCIAIGDRFVHLVGTAVVHLHLHLGEGPEELLDVGREFVDPHAGHGRQPDRPRDDVAHLLQLVSETLVVGDDFPAGLVKQLPLAGEGELLAGAFQEGNAEALLDRAELLADGGLGDPVERGGTAEGFRFHQIPKHAKRFHLHKI